MIRIITLIFIALYPIAPGFFKVANLDSGVILSCLYCAVYTVLKFHTSGKYKLNKTNLSIILSVFCCMVIPMLYHFEISKAIRTFVEYYLLILLLTDYFHSQERIDEAIRVILGVCSIWCLFGFYEAIIGQNLFSFLFNGTITDIGPDLQYRGAFARCETTFGHAITYAIYLSFNGIIASYYAITTKKKKYIFIYILIVCNLFLTISRAPIIVFIIVQMIMLYTLGIRFFVRALLKVLCVAAFILIFAGIIRPQIYSNLLEMATMVMAVFSENLAERVSYISNANPFEYRFELFRVIPQYIKGYWLMGRGIDLNFTFSMFGFTYYSIDNAFLYWVLTFGVVGLFGNVLSIFSIFIISMRNRRKNWTARVIICIVLIYTLNLLSVAQMAEYKIWIIIVSIVLAVRQLEKEKQAKDYQGREYEKS